MPCHMQFIKITIYAVNEIPDLKVLVFKHICKVYVYSKTLNHYRPHLHVGLTLTHVKSGVNIHTTHCNRIVTASVRPGGLNYK